MQTFDSLKTINHKKLLTAFKLQNNIYDMTENIEAAEGSGELIKSTRSFVIGLDGIVDPKKVKNVIENPVLALIQIYSEEVNLGKEVTVAKLTFLEAKSYKPEEFESIALVFKNSIKELYKQGVQRIVTVLNQD